MSIILLAFYDKNRQATVLELNGCAETLYKKTMHSAPVMLIWSSIILATRWSCSQQSLLSAGNPLQLHLVAGIRGALINITWEIYRSSLSSNIRSLGYVSV